MTTSKPTFTAVTQRSALGPLLPPLSKDDGESVQIAPLAIDPDVLFKEYRKGACTSADDIRIDRLIAVTRRLGASDRELLTRASCWPLSRVVEHNRTVGVLLPRAPAKFSFALQSLTGTGERKPLAIDWLAKDDAQQAKRGLPRMTFERRLTVCRDIAAVAAIFEQEKIVYADWSYANAFWSTSDFNGYVIDVDTCAFDSRPWVNTPNWEDHLAPKHGRIDNTTDRYRLALLVARCLSGEREPAAAVSTAQAKALGAGMPGLGQILATTVNARSREARPTVATILAAMTQSGPSSASTTGTNVTGWKQVGRKTPPRTTPSRPAPAARPAPPSRPTPPQRPAPVRPTPPFHVPSVPKPQPKPATQSTSDAADVIIGGLVLLGGLVVLVLLIVFIVQAIF
ncbi:hypothetical protein ACIA8G_27745 [Lentzea sp. NPDC051213]|uniref:hypothetical protein n=1 Tax=Lentzea sp. NPDC051213 TaxID=3364126 RepID=UPI0037AC69E3